MDLKELEKDGEGHAWFDAHMAADLKHEALGRKLKIYYAKDGDGKRLFENDKEPAVVLVLPGGGYEFCSYREDAVIAKAFNRLGFSAAVLEYSTKLLQDVLQDKEGLLWKPAGEVAAAIDAIRSEAALGLRGAKVVLCGFSAGGHLASTVCTRHADPALIRGHDFRGSVRPDGAVLSYPVISADEGCAHETTFTCLTGSGDRSAWQKFSSEKFVDEATPPVFVWHTAEDTMVPPLNSIRFAEAMWKKGRTAELMIYPTGAHGTSLATDEVEPEDEKFSLTDPYRTTWVARAVGFIRTYVLES